MLICLSVCFSWLVVCFLTFSTTIVISNHGKYHIPLSPNDSSYNLVLEFLYYFYIEFLCVIPQLQTIHPNRFQNLFFMYIDLILAKNRYKFLVLILNSPFFFSFFGFHIYFHLSFVSNFIPKYFAKNRAKLEFLLSSSFLMSLSFNRV